jgi:FlgD Ig-like domain
MRLNRLWPVLAGMLVFGFWAATAHAQSADGSVTLLWTAPGDDSLTGTAMRYDIRYSLFPITDANYNYCVGPGGLPRPGAPGTFQQFTVFGLLPGLRYYFAMKTADERLNWSKVSNVIAFAGTTVSVGGNSPRLAFGSPFPNPARSSTTFAYAAPAQTRIHVEIFDVQGRVVQVIADGEIPAGSATVRWDLRDYQGRAVPTGVYLARARLGDMVVTRRILVEH